MIEVLAAGNLIHAVTDVVILVIVYRHMKDGHGG